MTDITFCPQCGRICPWDDDESNLKEYKVCPDCKIPMVSSSITLEEYEKYGSKEWYAVAQRTYVTYSHHLLTNVR